MIMVLMIYNDKWSDEVYLARSNINSDQSLINFSRLLTLIVMLVNGVYGSICQNKFLGNQV